MIDDEQVMIYILNEILDAEQMADIFKMMMENFIMKKLKLSLLKI